MVLIVALFKKKKTPVYDFLFYHKLGVSYLY